MTDESGELAAQLAVLRDAFPGYRFRRRDFRGVPTFVAEARYAADAPLAAARSPEMLADMLAAAAGRPVRLRPAAVAAAYRDRLMTGETVRRDVRGVPDDDHEVPGRRGGGPAPARRRRR